MRIIYEDEHLAETGRYKNAFVFDDVNEKIFVYDFCGTFVTLNNSTVAGSGVVEAIVAGTNVTVDASDPTHPIVSSTGGGGGGGAVTSVNTQTGAVTLDSDDIAQGATNLYFLAAERTKLTAITGTNTGDETLASIKSKLGITTLSGSNTGDQDLSPYALISSLAAVATAGTYASLTGKPTYATVATTGAYSDLTGTPTIPAAQVNSDWSAVSGVAQILNKPTLATVATTGLIADTTGTLSAARGGTGNSTYAVGDLIQISAGPTFSRLAAVATGNVLISGGVTTASSWGKVNLTTHVTGTLPVGAGGTGATTLTGILKGTGTTAITPATAGTDYSVGTSALGTGILKSTTTTGALSIAVAADFPTLNQNTTGSAASATTATTANNSLALAGITPTGTPSSTNFLRGDGAWTTIGGGGDALVANPLSQFAPTTSLQLLGVISDETGTGALVFGTSPTLVTPALGTPSAVVLTNATGLPIAGITGLGTNIATALGTAANGTGAITLTTSPTFVTPVLGVATATSINKVTITAPTTSATLTLVTGSSLITAGAFAITLTSTAATNVTLPTTGTLATLAGVETWTNKTITNLKLTAGTTTVPMATLATGVVLTTPLSGAIEYDGAKLYFTTSTPTRQTIVTEGQTATLANKRLTPRVTSITSSATPTVNSDVTDAVTITALAAAITSMTSGLTGTPVNFDKLIFRIKDDGTARAITWGASFQSGAGTLLATTVVGKVHTVMFIYDSVVAKWVCMYSDAVGY